MAIKKIAKPIKEQAKDNTTTEKFKGKKVLSSKEGVILDNSIKVPTPDMSTGDTISVGLAKGLTKNMGNYQTLRVDCWITKSIPSDSTNEDIQEALDELSREIDSRLEIEVANSIEDED